MFIPILTFFLFIALLGGFCAAEEKPRGIEKAASSVVEAGNAFAMDLYAELCGHDENLFLSPLSISSALAMVCEGARGETREEMAEVLRISGEMETYRDAYLRLMSVLNPSNPEKSPGVETTLANAMWVHEGYKLLDDFTSTIESQYNGKTRNLDFVGDCEKARTRINQWVEEKTRDKIKDLLPEGSIDALTRLVLTNAIYFKGLWADPFEKKDTHRAPFFMLSGKKQEVDMMHGSERFPYYEEEDFQVLELPYAGDDYSMVLFLPRNAGGLADFEKRFTLEALQAWLNRLHRFKIKVFLPRFEITCPMDLGGVLIGMGMERAFSGGSADFSGMTGNRELFISRVVHKAFVKVDEEGTEAAAATGVVMSLTGISEPREFRADHPFLFIIRHKGTGAILFMGRVTQPE
ncbi:MAG: serpin family protein [Planctomycetota bacterium]|jgi:serpin B